MSSIDKIDKTNIPKHVAIIMDGNGRWAEQHGEERFKGHEKGAEALREVLKSARKIGVNYLTIYAFSTENWARPKDEVDALMSLLVHLITHETPSLKQSGVCLKAIGDIDALPIDVQESLNKSIAELSSCSEITLIIALSYSSRLEITHACKKLVEKAASGQLQATDVTVEMINEHLSTKSIPDPDLLIRTSGELRISNFLLWQIAYAELYFTPVLWPDFAEEHLVEAILDYQARQRRFGKTSQQIAE
ncbi:MAG: isoprenyl transferase [Mangrovibacterium sp.]